MTKENIMSRLKLFAMWGVWLIILISFMTLFVIGLPGFLQSFSFQAPILVYGAYYVVGWKLLSVFSFYGVALLIFWRKPHSWFAVFASMTLIAFGIGQGAYLAQVELYKDIFGTPLNYYIRHTAMSIGFIFSLALLFLFPTGEFAPRWTRWLTLGWTLWMVSGVIIPALHMASLPYSIRVWIQLIFYSIGIIAQVYRYQRISTPVQRQQTKWILWSCLFALLGFVIPYFISLLLPPEDLLLNDCYTLLVIIPFMHIPRILVALSLGFAILRYRLWDIDFFINRSLVYSGVTILLGTLFAGMFVAMQALMRMVLTDMPGIVIGVVSSMVVVALFFPVRDRLQCLVDTRFYGVSPNHERAVQIAIAQERDRLAQDLHDSVTQSLYGLTLLAESWRRLARDNQVKNLEEPLVEIGDVAQQALKEMRLLIYELRPPILEREGLLSALHQRLAMVEKRSGLEANLFAEDVVELPVAMEETLYLVAIEALNNAIKHAAASSVKISLRSEDRWVELEIADDGKGFDPKTGGGNNGMGLGGMQKRVEGVGGTLTIHSTPGQGTKVTARVLYHADPRKQRRAKVRCYDKDYSNSGC